MKYIQIIQGPEKIWSYNILLSERGEVSDSGAVICVPLEVDFKFLKQLVQEVFKDLKEFHLDEVPGQGSLVATIPNTSLGEVKEKIEACFEALRQMFS